MTHGSRKFGVYGPSRPALGRLAHCLTFPLYRRLAATRGYHRHDSELARERARTMVDKLARGEPVYLLGIAPFGHNSGVARVRASAREGLELVANNEEERFSGVKHCADFPAHSIDALLSQMREMGLGLDHIHAALASWDHVSLTAHGFRFMADELPASLSWLRRDAQDPAMTVEMVTRSMFEAPSRLGKQLGMKQPFPIVGMRHHDNHACVSYACSPFARSTDGEPVVIAVLDAAGDDGAISLYEGREGRLRMLYANGEAFDSLGMLYSLISSTQGGWTPLSSEGRYMGAAAWGDGGRLTNPYYMRLRQILYFGPAGQVCLNRALANWQRRSLLHPYTQELADILGPPIPREKLWNPDAVLDVEDVAESDVTQARVDKAAALQLVFEDALFHVIAHLIRSTGSHRLILTGGCALNCVANMRLLERFDEGWYAHHLRQAKTRLHLWVPPVPGDAGVTIGAAFNFAMSHGVAPGAPLAHAFYCGKAATADEIQGALHGSTEIASVLLGDPANPTRHSLVADFLAHAITGGAVIGIFQGRAETGPRALGHRSILADPRNPRTLELLNTKVKRREQLRPLAPMMTPEAARQFFELSPGAADADYSAYRFMGLTARARPEALAAIPAVIHRDCTGRIQIVRDDTDPFVHAYLKAMGRRAGVEVSVNTSLNVRGPIVQTPFQALETLKRSHGMDGLLFLAAGGEAFLAWHDVVRPPKDAGARLMDLLRAWQREVGTELVEPSLPNARRSVPPARTATGAPAPSLPPGPPYPRALQLAGWGFKTVQTMERCAARYGDAFTLLFPGYPPQVFFSHPDAIRDIFTGDPEVFRAGESNAVLEPFVGSRSLLVLDGKRHLAERKLIVPALHGERMQGYVGTMRGVAARAIATWPVGRTFAIHPRLQAMTLDVIMRAVLGIEESTSVGLRAKLQRFLAIGANPIWFFPWFQVDLGRFSPWGRIVRLRAAIGAALDAEIASRRRLSGPRRRDVLSMLMTARDEDARTLGDDELRDEMLTLLVAGHETTATALAWAFHHVLQDAAVLAKVTEELARVVSDAPVSAEHIPKLEYLDAVIKETLRLTPVLPVVGRVLAAPATIRDHTLPRGVYVNPCAYLTHRRGDLWPEPSRFRPERFLGARPSPYEFLPFGGGVRRCVGLAFATCEMKVVLAEVLSRFHLALGSSHGSRISHRSITFAPRGGVPVIAWPKSQQRFSSHRLDRST